MKAPNGQPTKLSEGLWIMVRTPFFKQWFGDWEKGDTTGAIRWAEANRAIIALFNTSDASTIPHESDHSKTSIRAAFWMIRSKPISPC